ncbi:MAG: OmpA family protein [Saprospiraceae bacterium]|nr:OmpA family protein [Saprospiraceae bacterium]
MKEQKLFKIGLKIFLIKVNIFIFCLLMILNSCPLFSRELAAFIILDLVRNEKFESKRKNLQTSNAYTILYFKCGKTSLSKSARKDLEELLQTLQKFPETMVSIEGHADSKGDSMKNQILSEKRAQVCRDFLLSNNISVERVMSRGFGSSKPIADNATAAGRKLNRRTEFYLISR